MAVLRSKPILMHHIGCERPREIVAPTALAPLAALIRSAKIQCSLRGICERAGDALLCLSGLGGVPNPILNCVVRERGGGGVPKYSCCEYDLYFFWSIMDLVGTPVFLSIRHFARLVKYCSSEASLL